MQARSLLPRATGASPLTPRARGATAVPIPRVCARRQAPCRASGGDFASSSSGGGDEAGAADARLDARPLFTLDRASAGDNLTFEDIRDAYEMCSTIPDAHERGQCYSVFNIDGERMAAYYDPVVRLEETLLLGGAAGGPRRALAEKAAAAAAADEQQQRGQQQRPPPQGADDGNPLAFLARFFFPGH